MSRILRCLTALTTLSLAGALASLTAPWLDVDERYKPGEFDAARESIAFSLFGQLRMSVGDLMWLKTLEYLHNGIIYRMPSESERLQGVEAHEFSDMGAGVAHVDGPSLVPNPEGDWRGPLGVLNRHIEPWRPGHAQHSAPQELIPWYQMLVRFNPNYVQAYTNGAFFMADFAAQPETARSFLHAGAKANPWSFEIQAALGRLLFDRFREYRKAARTLEHAVELAAAEKIWFENHGDGFDKVQEQLLGESYLFLARSYEALEQYAEAASTAEAGLELVPDYVLLRAEKRIALKKLGDVRNLDESNSH